MTGSVGGPAATGGSPDPAAAGGSPATAATVTQLWRYPVKSMGGEQVDRVELADAIPGDRGWGVVDISTGRLLSAKRFPLLLEGSARLDGVDRCILTLPGRVVASDDPGIDAALSSWLDLDVRLARPTVGESATIEIDWDEGAADLDPAAELPLFEFPTQPGWFFDSSSSLHLISEATLAHLESEVGAGAGDVRRYRPNIVVSTETAFAEDDWVESTIAFDGPAADAGGTATAWVKKRTDRCIVITRAQPGMEASRAALVWLAANHARDAGISAQPRSPGPIAVGDPVGPFAT